MAAQRAATQMPGRLLEVLHEASLLSDTATTPANKRRRRTVIAELRIEPQPGQSSGSKLGVLVVKVCACACVLLLRCV